MDAPSPQQALTATPDNLTSTEVAVDRVFSKLVGAAGFDVMSATSTDPFPNSALTVLASSGDNTNLPTASDEDIGKTQENEVTASAVQVVSTKDYTGIIVLVILALGAVATLGLVRG